ncbi:MAG: hypothetical protein Q8L86_10085 [Vicinamibacterales bacterium]|nr:hypothetical protein [Vicinamibacterales bacterium]
MPPSSTPVEYRVVRSLQSAIAAIAAGSTYWHTVASTAVKLDPNHKVEELIAPDGPRPFVLIDVQPERWSYPQSGQARLVMPITLHWIGESDRTVDESRDEVFFKACADLEAAIAVDVTRGGLAVDTRIVRRTLDDGMDGGQVWAIVETEVALHRTYGRPNG